MVDRINFSNLESSLSVDSYPAIPGLGFLPEPSTTAERRRKTSVHSTIAWNKVTQATPKPRAGITMVDGFGQHDDMTSTPDSAFQTLRLIRDWSNYGVSASRALGHWLGRATGAMVGLGIGGMTGLVDHYLHTGADTINTYSASALSKVSKAASSGLRAGADTGDWIGGHVARVLVNIFTLGAPKIINYLDRSFNGE